MARAIGTTSLTRSKKRHTLTPKRQSVMRSTSRWHRQETDVSRVWRSRCYTDLASSGPASSMLATKVFDEMHAADGSVRQCYGGYSGWLAEQSSELLGNKRAEADLVFRRVGI